MIFLAANALNISIITFIAKEKIGSVAHSLISKILARSLIFFIENLKRIYE